MARVIIEVDDDIIANAIAIWFESDGAIEAFIDSEQGDILENIRKDGTHVGRIESADVEFGESRYDLEHTVTLNLR